MTLCLVWREEDDTVCMATDSRVTVANNSYEDVAIKLTRIRCEIFPPSSKLLQGTGDFKLAVGMAFAGSHICAYVIKETLVEIISRLQYIPGNTEVSMDKLAKIAFFAYQELSKRVCSTTIGKNGICELFLSAFCPKENKMRVFKFSTNPKENTHSYTEVLRNPGLEMSGSGVQFAKHISYDQKSPLVILKDVIDRMQDPGVGGEIQYAKHTKGELKIFNSYGLSEDGWPQYMRAGLDVNKAISKADYDDFFISPMVYDFSQIRS